MNDDQVATHPTGMREVKGFLTSDNTFFHYDEEAQAIEHESKLGFRDWCQGNICIGGEWSATMVANEILENWSVVRKL